MLRSKALGMLFQLLEREDKEKTNMEIQSWESSRVIVLSEPSQIVPNSLWGFRVVFEGSLGVQGCI